VIALLEFKNAIMSKAVVTSANDHVLLAGILIFKKSFFQSKRLLDGLR
jgi:hypothetical protein